LSTGPAGSSVFQLRDGRELTVASTNTDEVANAALTFLLNEKKSKAMSLPAGFVLDGEGARVHFDKPWNADPSTPWPVRSRGRFFDWTGTLIVGGIGVGFYLLARVLAWVINGFLDQKPIG
jgi:hypothetical protein